MKFLIPNYSCLQNPWLGGYRPQIPVLSVLCPQLNLLTPPPPPENIPGYATVSFHVHVKSVEIVRVEFKVINEIQVLYILHSSDVQEETCINWGSVSAIYRPQEGRMFKLGMVCLSFFFLAQKPPHWAMASSFTRFLEHTTTQHSS